MAQVLPVVLTVLVHPDGLVVVVRCTVECDTTSGHAHPVKFLVVVLVVAGDVLSGATQSVRVADDTVAPVSEAGTHDVIGGEVLVVAVGDHHDGLLVGRVGDVGCAVQVPNHVAGHLPGLLVARRLPGAEVLGHQFQTMIVDQVGSHVLGLGILADGQITLDEQMHATLLVDLSHVAHLGL